MRKFSLPEIIVFAVAALLPTYLLRFHIGPFPTTVLEVVILVAIGTLAIQKFVIARSESRRATRQSRENITMAALFIRLLRRLWPPRNDDALLTIGSVLILIATIVGIIVAPDKRSALGIAKAFFWEPMALAWLIIAAKPDKEKIWRAMLGGFAVSALVVVVYGLLQYTHPALIPTTWRAERRITSVFDYPNAAALFLAPLVALLLSSPATIALAFFAVIVIILAKSAGGLIAVAAALFFLGVTNKKMRVTTMVVAATITIIVLFAPPAAGLREQILLQDWSGRVHVIGWKESLAMLRDHPIFGAGLDGFKTAVAPYHHAQGVEIFQYPHNLFLAIWSELGLLGLLGFVCVFVWLFVASARKRTPHPTLSPSGARGKYIIAVFIAILIHGLVDVPYFKNDLAMMFWLFIVLVAL